MNIKETSLPGVLELTPKRFSDHRGFFSEIYSRRRLQEYGIELDFVQENHSHSIDAGVLRGLHFQREPHAQAKLLCVTRGSLFDVVVDIRKGSPTFGKWVGLEISAEKGNQLLVPKGFAHGFVTLQANTDIFYKVTEFYSSEADRSIRYDDPEIGIDWPLGQGALIISDKDKSAPSLANVDNNYEYRGDI